jgi:phosphoglycolate phosphatase
MTYKAVIFDLDGTLLDTLGGLAASANRVLAANGYPTHAADSYRWFVGDGSGLLITRALPAQERSPENVARCLQAFLEDYNRNWQQATQPYEGMPTLLAQLANRPIAMSVVTNKPHRFCQAMIDHYLGATPFHCILGQREGVPKKPDPRQALEAAATMGIPPGECIFLGDSAVDIQTARRAGMLPVGAGWGFRPEQELRAAGADHILAHPLELLAFID